MLSKSASKIVDKKKIDLLASIESISLTSILPSRTGHKIMARFKRTEDNKTQIGIYSFELGSRPSLGKSLEDMKNFLVFAMGLFPWASKTIKLLQTKNDVGMNVRESDLISYVLPVFDNMTPDMEEYVASVMSVTESRIASYSKSKEYINHVNQVRREKVEDELRYWVVQGIESGINPDYMRDILNTAIISAVMKD
jgi:hypothetical protein